MVRNSTLHTVSNRSSAIAAAGVRLARRRSLLAALRGLLLRPAIKGRHVLWYGGWPMPKVVNRGGTVVSGGCTLFSGTRLEVNQGATITIGSGSYLNRNSLIICHDRVTIGSRCSISWDVVIMDSDEHEHPAIGTSSRPVEIQDGAWIGCRAIILKGVTIGTGAIVGAGSIVTRDVPPYSLAVGQPARVIRSWEPDFRPQQPPAEFGPPAH